SLASSLTVLGNMSKTTHCWPLAISRRTMFAPILPSPIIPSCMYSSGSRAQVARVIPKTDRGLARVVLVAERPETGGIEYEIASRRGREPEPARAEDSQDVAAREGEHVAVGGAGAGDDAVRARRDLVRRLAARTAVAEQVPVGPLGVDLDGAAALVGAVVPLEEVRLALGDGAEAGELAGAGGALERARQDPREAVAGQARRHELGVGLAVRGERQ